jgi:chromosome segregation ATPase
MSESSDAKLAKVETTLGVLVDEVRLLRESTDGIGDRITRLEESTREAIPQVWKLRERVAELERDTAQLQLDIERLRKDYETEQQTKSSRLWDVARMSLGPIMGAIAGWVAATFQRGLER